MSRATRRTALGRALAAAAALVGAGAGAKLAAGGGDRELVLYGRLRAHRGVAGAGERLAVLGELARQPDGEAIGRLLGAAFAVNESERLELHTFELPEGSIVGTGRADLAEGVFAILGGTGAYVGARGSYSVRVSPPELGGDGGAEFRLSLTS